MSAYAVARRSIAQKFDGTNQADIAAMITDSYWTLMHSLASEVKWAGGDGDTFKILPGQWLVVTNSGNDWSPEAALSQSDFETRWAILGGA